MAFVDAITAALAFLPPSLIVFLIATLPFIELRGAIPVGILIYHIDWPIVLLVAIIGNMLPVPAILWGSPPVERWFRRFPRWDRFLDRLFARTRRRHSAGVERRGVALLLIFVAVPLPMTGAWTGSLLAYLFDLDRITAFIAIAVGVLLSGIALVGVSLLLDGHLTPF